MGLFVGREVRARMTAYPVGTFQVLLRVLVLILWLEWPHKIDRRLQTTGTCLFDYNPNLGVCGAPVVGPPCYDPAIVKWRIQISETFPVGGNLE
ncbi:MAG: hypothetical protein JKY88_16985 [Pseudomonadales bacterium]|nr:hypothetical protein [Pseudomonadales bacterium]